MRPTLLLKTIIKMYPLRRAITIVGAPGGGKTSVVKQAAQQLGVPYIQIHLPTKLVEDFGIPDVMTQNNTFGYKMPSWFPIKGIAPDEGILCIDDRNQAGNDMQKVLANLEQEGEMHGVPMANWLIVNTGNRQQDRAGANRVLSHLSDRETEFELDTHLDDSTAWMIDHNIRQEVIAFLRFRPNLLHDFDPQRHKNPTPRSWCEGVSPVIGVVDPEAEYESFKGSVGEGAAAEFKGFLQIFRKLPNPDNIIMNPKTVDVPSDPATCYALAGALAQRASSSNFDRICTYVERMEPQFSVLSVSMATRRNPELCDTAAFTQWAVKHQDVLF